MAKKDKAALRPEVFTIRQYTEQVSDLKTLSKDELILAQGEATAFWQILKKHFDTEIEILEGISNEAIASGMALEEIGRNAIVINQTKGVLRRVMNRVKDASEAKEAQDAGGGAK